MIVGIDSDENIKKNKGEDRPIKNVQERKFMLENLKSVDKVVVFKNNDELLKLIENLKPDVLIKGADYKMKDIVGANFVLTNGGNVFTIPLVSGSTTETISQIKGVNKK